MFLSLNENSMTKNGNLSIVFDFPKKIGLPIFWLIHFEVLCLEISALQMFILKKLNAKISTFFARTISKVCVWVEQLNELKRAESDCSFILRF